MAQPLHQIDLNDTMLGYQVYGASGRKPALVFAHGYALQATGALYDGLLTRLARTFSVHALDLRGHGASAGSTAGWTFQAVADDVVTFANTLKLQRPVFVGHSFGAVIGLLAELQRPGTFSELCLLSPGPADHRRDPVGTLDALIEHGRDRDAMRHGFQAMFVRAPGNLLELALDAVTLVDRSVHHAQKSENPGFSIDDRLGEIGAPILLVRGKKDGVVAPERQHDMAHKLTHSKEVVFSGEGHMLPIESPEFAAREVLGFLAVEPATWP